MKNLFYKCYQYFQKLFYTKKKMKKQLEEMGIHLTDEELQLTLNIMKAL